MKSLFIFLITVFFGLSFDRLNIFKYCILSSILHEAGHTLAYRFSTGKWPGIKISVFGFTMENNISRHKYYTFILFAGPAVNLTSALAAAYLINKSFSFDLYVFMLVNTVIFIANILPVYYLDGGQILYSKSQFYRNNYRSISSFALIAACVMVLHFTDNPFPIIMFIFYFIINISNDI